MTNPLRGITSEDLKHKVLPVKEESLDLWGKRKPVATNMKSRNFVFARSMGLTQLGHDQQREGLKSLKSFQQNG